MAANTTRLRVAAKPRGCAVCGETISKGAAYLEHKSFPGSDDGWGDAAGHPVRIAECSACATRYGRGAALGGAA